MIIKYANGDMEGFKLGVRYARSEGTYYPHAIISDKSTGYTFKKGEVLAYNKYFFEPDMFDPTKLVLKNSLYAKTVLVESPETWEDSSGFSKNLANKLSSVITKVRSIVIKDKQAIHSVVQINSSISPTDTLLVIEDESTSASDIFNDESISLLKRLSANSVRAKTEGIVEKIEVFYNGAIEDFHPTIQNLINQSNKYRLQEAKATNNKPVTGEVNSDYRVAGIPLDINTAEIIFYISHSVKYTPGDKSVISNQLKTVTAIVYDYPITTDDGEEIDAVFGAKSVATRVVLSSDIIGTTTSLLKKVAKKAVELYNK